MRKSAQYPKAPDLSPGRPWVLDRGYADFREFHTSRHYVNKDKKEVEGLRLRLVLGSARARWRSSRPPFGADGHYTVGTHHADHKQIPALSFTTFITFGMPSQ